MNSDSLKFQSSKHFELENNSQQHIAVWCFLTSQSAVGSKNQKIKLEKERGFEFGGVGGNVIKLNIKCGDKGKKTNVEGTLRWLISKESPLLT